MYGCSLKLYLPRKRQLCSVSSQSTLTVAPLRDRGVEVRAAVIRERRRSTRSRSTSLIGPALPKPSPGATQPLANTKQQHPPSPLVASSKGGD